MEFFALLRNIITIVFLLSILSYYALFFIRRSRAKRTHKFKSITIIVPAHNEEEYIVECLERVLAARFPKKQVIMIDDGSKDRTYKLAKPFEKRGVKILRANHIGKSAALNLALKHAKGELVAIVDGDSFIQEHAIEKLAEEVGHKKTVAATGVVKIANRKKFICMWLQIELLYNSLIRSLFSKINANVVTPGALSVYRTKQLKEIKGFSTQGFSEDMDVTIRLIRQGWHVGFSDLAVSETNMPYDLKGFFRQRTRFARGAIDILKRHLRMNKTVIDIYTLPLLFFSYFQAVVMGSFTVYQLIVGYTQYFSSQGVYLNWYVVKFFVEWLSLAGFVRWFIGIFTGTTPMTIITVIGIAATLLSYPLFLFSIIKYDKKFTLWHFIPFFFMPCFWLVVMVLYTVCLPEIFRKKQYNRWKKN